MVVLPAPSNPKIRILSSFWPNNEENKLEKKLPVEKWNNRLRIYGQFELCKATKLNNIPILRSATEWSNARLIAWLNFDPVSSYKPACNIPPHR